MKTVMSVVIDNKACNGLKGEWGLSIVVDYKGKKILVLGHLISLLIIWRS